MLLAPSGRKAVATDRRVGRTDRRTNARKCERAGGITTSRTVLRSIGVLCGAGQRGRTDGRTDGRTNGRTGRLADGWTDGRTDRRADGRAVGRACGAACRPSRHRVTLQPPSVRQSSRDGEGLCSAGTDLLIDCILSHWPRSATSYWPTGRPPQRPAAERRHRAIDLRLPTLWRYHSIYSSSKK